MLTPEQEKLVSRHMNQVLGEIMYDLVEGDESISIPRDEVVDVVLDQTADDHRSGNTSRLGHRMSPELIEALKALHEMSFEEMTKTVSKMFPASRYGL